MPVLGINVTYLLIAVLISIYGSFYVAFSPSEVTVAWAKNSSIIFFVYFIASSTIFFIKNKQKLSKIFKNRLGFYFFIIVGLPSVFALLAYVHFGALSKGVPALYTELFSEEIFTETEITSKRAWGKRGRHEAVSISGFSDRFPVSRQYYDSVSVGESVKLKIIKSELGTKIEFVKP
ncbi:hypothetical protein HNE05_03630 [Aquipseudomonas campi]|uniref:Uncharacterized protein n=1 Tax=Aquipseudomonas campi TaxID=2731681 RepID=A0A6M8FQV7_9GAMM|nr:hypothetical protein [Pseudomonas campi]QKE62486.1 hypothetical protein HNE05_03630 [Pseudomonas campi]